MFRAAGVDVEGVGLAAVGGQGAHELAGEVFVEGFGCDGGDEFSDQFGVPAAVEVDVDAIGEHLVAALGEALSLGRQVLTGETGQRLTAEEVEGTLILTGRGVEIAAIPVLRCRAYGGLEDVMSSVSSSTQRYPLGVRFEDFGGQHAPKPIDGRREPL